MRSHSHPVIQAIIDQGRLNDDDLEYLIKHGRKFVGRPLPKGIEKRRINTCHEAAEELEKAGVGEYVRGYALRPDGKILAEHSWVTRDRWTVIDPTWNMQIYCDYWGLIGWKHEARLRKMSRDKSSGFFHIPKFTLLTMP